MDRWLGGGETLVAVALAIPGVQKTPPGAAALFEWVVTELSRALPRARRVHATSDALGPFELWCTDADAAAVKHRCVALETETPAARLADVDVYSPEGVPVDRSSLHLPPRPCLCCAEPARDCIRGGRHAPTEVVASALRLLAGVGAGAPGGGAR
jgi:holo-ACP synthase CitX